MKLESLKTKLNSFPIMFSSPKLDNPILLTRGGRVGNNEDFPNAECVIFPSKDRRDWSKFKKPIKIDTPFMVCGDPERFSWHLAYYSHYDEESGKHRVYSNGEKSKPNYNSPTNVYHCMIPYDKFDPNNIEESLKYNIQK